MPYAITIPGTTGGASGQSSPLHRGNTPGIPIYLEAHDDRCFPKTYGTTPTTPTTPEIINPKGEMTHLKPINANNPHPQVSPVDPSPITTIQTTSDRSVIWPIPEPPPEIVQPPSRRPLLRFFPTDRPRVRLDGLSVDTTCEKEKIQLGSRPKSNYLGLGINNGPPKPPSIRVQPPPFENEKTGYVPNIAQRFEEKIWRYNASGNILERWLLEIVSWLISAMCMAAIVAVLIVLQDKPVSKWPFKDIGLSLNAFVSVLSRVAGAALLLPVAEAIGQLKWSWFIKGDSKKMWDFEMFDNASRGPWGAFLLLIHTKGKTIAALGALVTLFALALDPFFQQLVSFPDKWTQLEAESSIARLVRYEPRYPVEYQNNIPVVSLDVDIQAVADPYFLDNGTQPIALGNGSRAEIPLTCPSSNCTWPSYNTLGMCSQCVATPQLLTFTCMSTRVDWTSQLNATVSSYPNATVCGYFLNATSTQPVLMSGYLINKEDNKIGEALMMRTVPLISNPTRTPLYGKGTINFPNIRNPIADALISTLSDVHEVYANKTPILQECIVSWCVKTIQSSYYMGTYSEEVTHTFVNDSQGPVPWHTYRNNEQNITVANYAENVTIDAPSTGQNFSRYGWGLSNDTMAYTVAIFDRIFPAFTTAVNASAKPVLRWRLGHPTQVRTKLLDFNPWIQETNITHYMERMVGGITNAVRSSTSKEFVTGKAFDSEAYVEVTWAWISLPASLLLISFVFLLATVIKSAREKHQVSIRKNSAIATLLYGLPDHYQKRLAKADSTNGTPRTKARELKVRLSATRGWRASGDAFSPMTPKAPKNLPPPGWI